MRTAQDQIARNRYVPANTISP